MVRLDFTGILSLGLVSLVHAQTYSNGTNSSSSLAGAIYKDPSQPVGARVQDLVARMTIEEKMAQLMQGGYLEPSYMIRY